MTKEKIIELFHKFMDSHGYIVTFVGLCLLASTNYVTMNDELISLGLICLSLFGTSLVVWGLIKFLFSS